MALRTERLVNLLFRSGLETKRDAIHRRGGFSSWTQTSRATNDEIPAFHGLEKTSDRIATNGWLCFDGETLVEHASPARSKE